MKRTAEQTESPVARNTWWIDLVMFVNHTVRFTLAPDGKTFAYSIAKQSSGMWMLQGVAGK